MYVAVVVTLPQAVRPVTVIVSVIVWPPSPVTDVYAGVSVVVPVNKPPASPDFVHNIEV